MIGSGINTGVTGLTNNSLFADSAYYVVVTDNNNCTQELPMPLLSSPGEIDISGTPNDILCNGDANGSISITATGGNGTLTAAWTTLVPGSGIVPGDEDQTGLSGGTYKVVITDNNGCQDSGNSTSIKSIDFSKLDVDVLEIIGSLSIIFSSPSAAR